jgi:ABC-type transport system involved in multi-copper enzyme maturation permease subunit
MKNLYMFWMSGYLRQGKTLAAFLIVILLILVNFLSFSERIVEERKIEDEEQARMLEQFRQHSKNPESLAKHAYILQVPRSEFEFLVNSGFSQLPIKRTVSPYRRELPVSPASDQTMNANTESVDLVFIVEVLLTFVAIALSFDAINGEKRTGTMKLLLSNSLPRWKIVISKFAAVTSVLFMPILLGSMLHLFLISVFGPVSLSVETILLYALFVISSLPLLMLFTALGMSVSAAFKSPVTGFVILVMIWTAVVLILPGTARHLGKMSVETETIEQYQKKLNDVEFDLESEAVRKRATTRPPEMAQADDYKGEKVLNEIKNRTFARFNAISDEQYNSYYQQAIAIHRLSLISPSYTFRYAMASMTDQDFRTVNRFADITRKYSETLFRSIQQADAADNNSPHLIYLANSGDGGYISSKPFSTPPPAFEFRAASVVERIISSILPVGLLVLEMAILLIVAVVLFNRFDVR